MAIRDLGAKEIAIVSGGYLDSVTVRGVYPSSIDYWSVYQDYNDEALNNSVDYGSGGDGGPDEPPCHHDLTEKQKIDALATQLEAQIKAMPDWQKNEYTAVLYKMPDGTIATTNLYKGDGGNASEATKLALTEAGGVANLGNIIGIIHNHPESLINKNHENMSAAIENMPSNDDWITAKALFGDRTDFALYILGPDGGLRVYQNSDRALWDARNEPDYYERHKGQYDNWADNADLTPPCLE